jgi:hypothetical protein
MTKGSTRKSLALLGLGALASSAPAQWTAVSLHPAGGVSSEVFAVGAGVQGGFAEVPAARPTVWAGTSQSMTLLQPNDGGNVYAIWGDAQGGSSAMGACIWHGTPESRVDLRPGVVSVVHAMRGDQQVGVVTGRAALWNWTPSSYVDLHPPGHASSRALATDGEYQGGYVLGPHAALWHGSAASFVDMNPSWSGGSEIKGMAPGQQVGCVASATLGTHAALWSGTPESCIDMHPGGGGMSLLYATIGNVQAGYLSNSSTGGLPHAGIWFGTPGSFFDLHTFLPPGYSDSIARALYRDGDTLYVGGAAWRNSRYEAFLWTGTIPAPASAALICFSAPLIAPRRRR